MKYFGFCDYDEFIEAVTLGSHLDLYYKDSTYTMWEEDVGFFIQKDTLTEDNEIYSYKTLDELLDQYRLYDGVLLREAFESDI